MPERRVAHSFDCDGVLVWGIPAQADVLPWKSRGVVLPSKLPILDRAVDETPLTRWEQPNYKWHAWRRVTNQAAWAVILISPSDNIFLNTGRENKRAYVDLTEASLNRAGIRDRFNDLFFGVKGLSTVISKLVWLDQLSQRYDQVYHYDDNPRTALTVEQYFRQRGDRNVRSILVRDLSTGLLTKGVDLEKEHPNLVVAKNIREAVRLAKN